ncbi:MAG: CGNR zinc finger domain-containing protein [Bradyrhizobium sp.]
MTALRGKRLPTWLWPWAADCRAQLPNPSSEQNQGFWCSMPACGNQAKARRPLRSERGGARIGVTSQDLPSSG